jgi:hypothetical protein
MLLQSFWQLQAIRTSNGNSGIISTTLPLGQLKVKSVLKDRKDISEENGSISEFMSDNVDSIDKLHSLDSRVIDIEMYIRENKSEIDILKSLIRSLEAKVNRASSSPVHSITPTPTSNKNKTDLQKQQASSMTPILENLQRIRSSFLDLISAIYMLYIFVALFPVRMTYKVIHILIQRFIHIDIYYNSLSNT